MFMRLCVRDDRKIACAAIRCDGISTRCLHMARQSCDASAAFSHARAEAAYLIVGMTNSAPSLVPDGQREVTVLVLV
jgi:hypothetical protein